MTFRVRLVLAATAAVTIAVLLACAAAWVVARNSLLRSVDDTLYQSSQLTINRATIATNQSNGAYTQVTGASGTVLLTTANPALPVNALVRSYAEGNEEGYSYVTIEYQGVVLREMISPLQPGQQIGTGQGTGFLPETAALQLAQPLTGVNQQLRQLGGTLLFVAAGGVLIAILLGLLVAQTVIRPLNKVTDAIEDLAETTDLS
ncbi:MAG: hypothetical protein F2757_08820, partial [Actinobacteria bacterium]|nr:hypothetical protein [Actinomycetota bacterium]